MQKRTMKDKVQPVFLHVPYVSLFCAVCFFLMLAGAVHAEEWASRSTTLAISATLRGYGQVRTVRVDWAAASGEGLVEEQFYCTTNENAQTLGGKFLADLDMSYKTENIMLGKSVSARKTFSGSCYVVCLQGSLVRIFCAESGKTLTDFFASHAELSAGATVQAKYPTYLDRFDRYGWGVYGLAGFSNFHSWMKKADGENTFKDPYEDFDFLAKQRIRFEPWLDPAGFDDSDGVLKNTGTDWKMAAAHKAGLPVSFRVYGSEGGADWTARRFPEYMEKPASFLQSGWHGGNLFFKASPHLSWYDPDPQRYMAVQVMKMMKAHVNDDLVMGWMHPHGELAHDTWYDLHDDYSNASQKSWVRYLHEKNVTLEEVSALAGHRLVSWDEVTVPEFASFAGLPQRVLSLEGKWQYRSENTPEKMDAGWLALPKEERYEGVGGKWWDNAENASEWNTVHMPGGEAIYAILGGKKNMSAGTWFRRHFTLTKSQLTKTPVYLYWFPISHVSLHSGDHRMYHGVYINGQKAGEVGSWGALDVSKFVAVGDNKIALHLLGGMWNGRIFLSTEKPAAFPYFGKEKNRLFLLWTEWHKQVKYDAWADILDGMRQVDPNRPIKFMAPIRFGEDLWLKLAHDYGGWGHFTGEGMWFFPWYKRYGFLYDLPASSETAGPADSLTDQFNSFRRTFMAGLNGHDPVFLAQTYTRNPELRKFWIEHDTVLKRMGKYDLDGPQVLIYRSSFNTGGSPVSSPYPELGQSTRLVQSPWNWDIGRGTLQRLGHSYLYLDDGGVADGKMTGYKLMVDCGNETIDPETIVQIRSWIENGGMFVALPFTGRNTRLEPDVWPVEKLTDCKVAKLRIPGKGKVTILPDNGVFTTLAGKTFDDVGRCLDYVGNNYDVINAVLEPGKDSKVLAKYEDGSAAIVETRIGKGRVIALGSTFWRSAQDRNGVWWPEGIEAEFVSDLFDGLGFGKPEFASSDSLVWPQPYRSNNGLDHVCVLVSWNEEKDVTSEITVRLAKKPAAIVCYGIDGVKELPFTYAEGQAVVKVGMPAREVKVLSVQTEKPDDALSHWWSYQQKMWHTLAEPHVDFTPYTQGKWADPAIDLARGAKATVKKPAGDWMAAGFDDSKWDDVCLGVLNANDNIPKKSDVWVRKSFTVPDEWLQSGRTYLISGAWVGPHYLSSTSMYFNGEEMHGPLRTVYGKSSIPVFKRDITKLLQDGANVVSFAIQGDFDYQGFAGNVYLYHRDAPLRSIDLAGTWDALDASGKPVVLTLPSEKTVSGNMPKRTIRIPAEWEGKYQIRVRLEGGKQSTIGVFVNDYMVRRHHHNLTAGADLDITNRLRFGEDNEIRLSGAMEWHELHLAEAPNGKVDSWNLTTIRLELFPVK